MQKVPNTSILKLSDLCKRWGVTQTKIYSLEDEGKLKRLDIGAYYSTADVLRLENQGEEANTYDFKRMKRELEEEKEKVYRLEKTIETINRLTNGGNIYDIG